MIFFGYAIMLFPAGAMGDRVGSKKVIFAGVILSITANLLFFYILSYDQAATAMFLNGLGQGMVWAPLMKLMANHYPKDKMDFIVGVLSTSAILGPTLAIVFSGFLGSVYGWKVSFIFPPIILATLASTLLTVGERCKDMKIESRVVDRRPMADVLFNQDVWLVGFGYFSFYATLRGFLSWMPTYLKVELGMSLFIASTLVGIYAFIGIIGGFVGVWFSRRSEISKKMMISSSLASTIPLFIILPMVESHSAIILFIAFFTLSLSGFLYFAYPPMFLPVEAMGTASGLIDALGYLGAFVGALSTGLIIEAYVSYAPAFYLLAVITGLGAVAVLKVRD